MEEMKMNVVVKDTTAYIFNRKIVIARENLVKAQENLAHTFPRTAGMHRWLLDEVWFAERRLSEIKTLAHCVFRDKESKRKAFGDKFPELLRL